ncbi:hypothetical protein CRI94_09360 [Longibacter salinarum]|uniref:Uncharacterized protein n=1 Tax=Longibacter salinarum TaxID=1850348 RepID=A0A2A8CY34_9BACT|nr:hypothetical protein [Longibacter salinarum]PEN13513.1 hypothetical protein CRI94_09360 [Longibacter salinarum]
MRSLQTGFLSLLFVLLISGSTAAQPVTQAPARSGDYVAVDWNKPVFSVPTVFESLSSAAFVSGRVSINKTVRLVADLPFGYGAIDANYVSSDQYISDVGLGNPYIGIEYASGHHFLLESGVRLPINTVDKAPLASVIGQIAVTNRVMAFVPDYLTMYAVGNYVHTLEDSPIEFRLRGGPAFALFTGDASGSNEMLAIIDLGGWYVGETYELGVGYSSRVVLGEDAQSELGVSGFARVKGVYPGLTLGVPVGDGLRDSVSFILGATIRVPIN